MGAPTSGSHYNNGLIDSGTLSGDLFINYTYSPKLTVGIGGTFGYNWVDSFNPDQTYEQGNLRATYQVSGKVNLNASVGVEFRQFEGDFSTGDEVSPSTSSARNISLSMALRSRLAAAGAS